MRVPLPVKFALRALGNVHRAGAAPDIFLFATPRGGSTWLMEIIASQPGLKFYDEPFNSGRDFAERLRDIPKLEQLMPDAGAGERILSFLQELQRGRFGSMNPTPFRPNHRFFTNRIVFKLHELEHMMAEVARRCGGCVIYLLRHPISTSISRNKLPRLELFLQSKHYADRIGDSARLREIRHVANSGDHFQRAVVSWCFENLDLASVRDCNGLLVTYEELVMNPDRSCDLLLERLQLPDREAMRNAFEQPASNINMSHAQTFDALTHREAGARRFALVTKWQQRVTAEQRQQAARILQLFDIDSYTADDPMPRLAYLHFGDTMTLYDAARAAPAP